MKLLRRYNVIDCKLICQCLFCMGTLSLFAACATRLENAPVVERSGVSGASVYNHQPSMLPRSDHPVGPDHSLNANPEIASAVSVAPVTHGEVQTQPLNGEPSTAVTSTGTLQDPKGRTPTPPAASSIPESAIGAPSFPNPSDQEEEQPLLSKTIALSWPVRGPLLNRFDEKRNRGINIGGRAGRPVRSAASGRVVYAGNGLRGYGNLIIIKHDALFLTAYAHNRAFFVREGDIVTKGQKIAEMGNSDTNRVMLHFEVRRQGKPVDPLQYLPPQRK